MKEWNELPVAVRTSPRRMYEYIKEAIDGKPSNKKTTNDNEGE